MLERTLHEDRTDITFVLPADTPPGAVSVVGEFNDRQPGAHTPRPRKDGKRAVTVELPIESTHPFRYLAAGDHWFNDESAGDEDGPTAVFTPESGAAVARAGRMLPGIPIPCGPPGCSALLGREPGGRRGVLPRGSGSMRGAGYAGPAL
ncbi:MULTISPECIES: isoamylase early set domain-containing protein [Streptomyces]|uniref:Isoamylase early set domain-containing protein n=1 Tax=Streptomyces virginiae TaxID=1961 RepID=A0ABZ1TEN4_STRVG|nr:isoamylase early set domain-containing protein [Streptomyces virginiae]WTB23553.1 isoamylase early set domain-containing protein [Streptomyces virginiae]